MTVRLVVLVGVKIIGNGVMANLAPTEFINQVRQEASKVTWSSKKDTITSTIVVLVMVLVASVFFLAVDAVVFYVVQAILGF